MSAAGEPEALEAMARKKRYWHIVGYDSTTKIYEDKVLHGCYTEHEMANLLRALVSCAGLTFREIVDSYARSNARRYRSLLEVHRESGPKKFSLMCGSNPYFIASVVEEWTSNNSLQQRTPRKRCAVELRR